MTGLDRVSAWDAKLLRVRMAGPPDMPVLYALRHKVFVVGQDVPEDLERDEDDETCDHVVAVQDGRVVGTGRLLRWSDGGPAGTGTIGRMAVAASDRGRGVGSAVLARLEERAAEVGLTAVELHAQLHAQQFYGRAGYRPHGAVYLEAGIEHISMRKELATVT